MAGDCPAGSITLPGGKRFWHCHRCVSSTRFSGTCPEPRTPCPCHLSHYLVWQGGFLTWHGDPAYD